MNPELQPGWRPDPHQSGQLRWWDGQTWSEHTHPVPGPTPTPRAALVGEPAQIVSSETRPTTYATSATLAPGQAASYRRDVPPFYFDGGAGTYIGTGIVAALVTVFTLGICFPFALVLFERWKAKHTYVEGRRLMFTGTGMGLFGNWLKWLLLMIITLGIYGFWVVPRLTKWRTERLAFDPAHQPQ